MEQKIYILDCSSIKKMVEGDPIFEKQLDRLLQTKDVRVMSTLSSVLRAILVSKPNVIIKNIQKILNIIEIYNDDTDYRNARQVQDRITKFAEQTKGI